MTTFEQDRVEWQQIVGRFWGQMATPIHAQLEDELRGRLNDQIETPIWRQIRPRLDDLLSDAFYLKVKQQ